MSAKPTFISQPPSFEIGDKAATLADVLGFIARSPTLGRHRGDGLETLTLPVPNNGYRQNNIYQHVIVIENFNLVDMTWLSIQIHSHHVDMPQEVYRHADYRILNRIDLLP